MHDAHAINLRWLIMLRWGAIIGQLATVAVATICRISLLRLPG